MLIIRTALIGRATKKSSHVFRRPVYSGIPFCTSVLISEFAAEKTGLFELEDFLFGLHRLLVEKQDSVDVKTFFLSLPIFGGKTGLCRREDFFFWSSPILGVLERIHRLSKSTDEQKVWETLA